MLEPYSFVLSSKTVGCSFPLAILATFPPGRLPSTVFVRNSRWYLPSTLAAWVLPAQS